MPKAKAESAGKQGQKTAPQLFGGVSLSVDAPPELLTSEGYAFGLQLGVVQILGGPDKELEPCLHGTLEKKQRRPLTLWARFRENGGIDLEEVEAALREVATTGEVPADQSDWSSVRLVWGRESGPSELFEDYQPSPVEEGVTDEAKIDNMYDVKETEHDDQKRQRPKWADTVPPGLDELNPPGRPSQVAERATVTSGEMVALATITKLLDAHPALVTLVRAKCDETCPQVEVPSSQLGRPLAKQANSEVCVTSIGVMAGFDRLESELGLTRREKIERFEAMLQGLERIGHFDSLEETKAAAKRVQDFTKVATIRVQLFHDGVAVNLRGVRGGPYGAYQLRTTSSKPDAVYNDQAFPPLTVEA